MNSLVGQIKSPETVTQVVKALKSNDKTIRLQALNAVGLLGPVAKDAVPELMRALEDPDRLIRSNSLNALAGIGPDAKEAFSVIIPFLKDHDSYTSFGALKALAQIGEPPNEVGPALGIFLKNRIYDKSQTGYPDFPNLLRKMGQAVKETVPEIIRILDEPSYEPRIRAINTLSDIGPLAEDAMPRIKKLLKDPNRSIRIAAIRALCEIDSTSKSVRSEIINALEDPEPWIRGTAVQMLWKMGEVDNETLPLTVQLLNKKNLGIDYEGAKTLSRVGDAARGVVPELVKMLKTPELSKKLGVLNALGEMGAVAQEAVPDIIHSLNDPNPSIRSMAAEALGKIGKAVNSAVPDITRLLNDPSEQVRSQANYALGMLGESAKIAIPNIVNSLGDPSPSVRSSALKALMMIGPVPQDAIPKVNRLLEDSESSVRISAVLLLGSMGVVSKDALPRIVGMMDGDRFINTRLRDTALQALGSLGPVARDYVPDIAKLLDSSDQLFRHGLERNQMDFRWDDSLRRLRYRVAQTLETMGPLGFKEIVHVLDPIYRNPSLVGELRFLAHFLGGGNKDVEILLQWVGGSKQEPSLSSYYNAIQILRVFDKAWDASSSIPAFRDDLEKKILVIVMTVNWHSDDLPLLVSLAQKFESVGSTHVAAVHSAISSLSKKDDESWTSIVFKIGIIWGPIGAIVAVLGLWLRWLPIEMRIRESVRNAEPQLSFTIGSYGGPGGHGIALNLQNQGTVSAYNLALYLPGVDGPAWQIAELSAGVRLYIQIALPDDSPVRIKEITGLAARLVYHDRFGIQYVAVLDLVQQPRDDGFYNIIAALQGPMITRPMIRFVDLWQLRKCI